MKLRTLKISVLVSPIVVYGATDYEDGFIFSDFVWLCDRRLHPYVFRDLIAGFKEGVQVNAFSGACYSGKFIDAIKTSNQRDLYFTTAAGGVK